MEAKRLRAARTMRLAIEQLDEVYQSAEADSEIEAQAQEALTEIRALPFRGLNGSPRST